MGQRSGQREGGTPFVWNVIELFKPIEQRERTVTAKAGRVKLEEKNIYCPRELTRKLYDSRRNIYNTGSDFKLGSLAIVNTSQYNKDEYNYEWTSAWGFASTLWNLSKKNSKWKWDSNRLKIKVNFVYPAIYTSQIIYFSIHCFESICFLNNEVKTDK